MDGSKGAWSALGGGKGGAEGGREAVSINILGDKAALSSSVARSFGQPQTHAFWVHLDMLKNVPVRCLNLVEWLLRSKNMIGDLVEGK